MTSDSDGPVRGGGIVPPSSDGDAGKGSAAWQRLKAGAHQTWSDWRLVGVALLVGRQEAMRIACSNSTNGGRYRTAFGYWLRKNGFADLDKRTRADLLRIMECLAPVESWRAGLKADHQLRYNHPTTIWRRWSASNRGPTRRRSSSTEPYEEEVRRLQEENDRLRAQLHRVLARGLDRARLAKILGMLASNQSGEVLNAARMAEDMRLQANVTWEDVLGVT